MEFEVKQRQCYRCGLWKPANVETFGIDRKARDWCSYICIACRLIEQPAKQRKPQRASKRNMEVVRANRNKWKANNPEKVRAEKKRYYEKNKGRIRDRDNARKRQLRRDNPELVHSREREYAARNSLRMKSRNAVKNERRRAIRFLTATPNYKTNDIVSQYNSQKGLCWWCGISVGLNFHIDHRVPLSRGGSNDPRNLCISCPTCNSSKHDKLPHEWNGRLL